jgi:putative peptidoglycan lipid II flippase
MNNKFTSTITGASIFISVVGLISRGLGFVREMIFAHNFGLETDFDLYLVGAVLPITINTIILYIGQNYFVPGFQKLNSTDNDAASKFYRNSFLIFVGFGVVVSILLFITSDLIIKLYIGKASTDSIELATNIFRIFILTIPFSTAISIFSALQQAVYEFKYPAISILFLNISLIVLLLLFSSKIGVYIIPIGYVTGTLIQFLFLLIKSQKLVKLKVFTSIHRYKISESFTGLTLIMIIIIEILSQLYSFFDRYFYSEITTGGIAALNYAYIIWLLPITIISLSLATAIFPIITKSLNENSIDQVERIYNENISVNTFIFVPIAFIFFFNGDTLIKIFFERGKFIESSTDMTFNALKYYSISLAFFSVYVVFNKLFYSLNKVKLLLWITVIGIVIKFVFNFLLIQYEQNGLALSTSISYIFYFFVSYIMLNITLKISNKAIFIQEFLVHLLNASIAFSSAIIISGVTGSNSLIFNVIFIILFITIYVLNAHLLNYMGINIFFRVIKAIPIRDKISAIIGRY